MSLARPLVGFLLAACLSCGGGAGTLAPTGPLALDGLQWRELRADTSVILIVNDTMRRDRIGIYGGPARTPAFDAFARDNILFDAAYSQSPWTKPAMTTLFTSLYPSQHGVLSHPSIRERQGIEIKEADQWMDVMGDDYTTLAEVMSGAALRTAAFVGNPWLKKEFGYDQGFDHYDDTFASWEAPGTLVSRAGLDWLAGIDAGERFFLYLHYMDTHRPYGRLSRGEIEEQAPEVAASASRLAPEVRQQIADVVWLEDGTLASDAGFEPSIELLEMAYDRGVETFDAALGEFLDDFARHEAWDRTAIVVVSDHGEALYTRGWGNHGGGLYEDEVAIPLAARFPGITFEGERVASAVGLVDLFPTLCTYVGIEAPGTPLFGRSWLQPAGDNGVIRDRYLVTEGVMFRPNNRTVRRGEYKAMWQPHVRSDGKDRALFRIVADPWEANDLLIGGQLEDAADIFNQLLQGGRGEVVPFEAPGMHYMPLDPELEERLRTLGYIR